MDNNDREYPVRYEDLRVGMIYYIEEKQYDNDPDNHDYLAMHGTIKELITSPSGVKRVTARFENGNTFSVAFENYKFFPRPHHWETTYKSAARNAAKLATAKRNYRDKRYGVMAAKKLPIPNALKQKVGSYLSGLNIPLNTQKQLLKAQVEEIKGPEPGMKGRRLSRKLRNTRRDKTRKRRSTRRNK